MGYLSERINYIKGLADGLELGTDSKEAKILAALIELIDDMAFSIESLEEEQDIINDDLDDLDEAVGELEECVYDECPCCDDECDCCPYEFEPVECPACGAEIELDDDILDDECASFICPSCGEKIFIDWTDEDEEDAEDEDEHCECCHPHHHHHHHHHHDHIEIEDAPEEE